MTTSETPRAPALLEPTWTPAAYQGFAEHDDPEVRAWALRRLALLHPDAAEEEDDDEVPRAITAEEAPALRQRAITGLGRSDLDENLALLDSLKRCPWRWVPLLLGERLDALLASPADDAAWACIEALGDPSLLDAVLRAWRPGEPAIAGKAVFLARLADRLQDVPATVRDEAAKEHRRMQDILQGLESGQLPIDPSTPLLLGLRCTACHRSYTYEAEQIFVSPALARSEGQGSDGYFLSRIVLCKGCEARDQYELTASAHRRLLVELLLQQANKCAPQSGRVVVAEPKLWDGTTIRNPTQGIEHLRALAEQQPEVGEAWRRLGNLYERFGLMQEAEEAWLRAVADEAEAEAAYSLALRLANNGERTQEWFDFVQMALERMPQADLADEVRARAATDLCTMLRDVVPHVRSAIGLRAAWMGQETRGRQVLHASGADLRRIPDWDRLAELIGQGFFISLAFTTELLDDDESQLLDLLAGPLPGSGPRTPTVRDGQKISRNDPCPCGSGRKYKRCCLGKTR